MKVKSSSFKRLNCVNQIDSIHWRISNLILIVKTFKMLKKFLKNYKNLMMIIHQQQYLKKEQIVR